MTAGNRVVDSRTPVATAHNGTRQTGHYSTKTWNGADYPKRSRVNRIPTPPVISYYEAEFWMHGKKYKRTFRLKQKVYTPRSRPPKRASTVDHPYTMSSSRRYQAIYYYGTNLDVTFSGGGWAGVSVMPSAPWDSNDDIKLLGKLREKIAGSDFNLAVTLGEGRESLSMIADAAKRIAGAALAVRRGNIKKAAYLLTAGTDRESLLNTRKIKNISGVKSSTAGSRKVLADNWLQLQYGWLPLLNDVKNGAEFLAHNLNTPQQQVIRTSHTHFKPVGDIGATTSPTVSKFIKTEGYTRKSLKAIIREKNVAQLAGLADPLSLAWELLPYSFVVDWFIPVGNYLSARGLASSVEGTFVISSKTFQRVDGIKATDGTFAGAGFVENVSFSRTVSNSLSVPQPSVKSFGQAATWKHAVNAIALLNAPFDRRSIQSVTNQTAFRSG